MILLGNVTFPLAVQLDLVDEANRTTPFANEDPQTAEAGG